jgi:hypothetical protein
MIHILLEQASQALSNWSLTKSDFLVSHGCEAANFDRIALFRR